MTSNGKLLQLMCYWVFSYSLMFSQDTSIDSLKLQLAKPISVTEKVRTLHRLAAKSKNTQQSINYAKQAFLLSESSQDLELHAQSYVDLSRAYKLMNRIDSMKMILLESIPFLEENKLHFFHAAAFRNLAVVGEFTRQPDSSLHYLSKCLEILSEHPDSTVMMDVYMSQGIAFQVKGFYELSTQALLNTKRYLVGSPQTNKKGYAAMNLAINYEKLGQFDKALEQDKEAISYLEIINDEFGLTHLYNNIALIHKELGDYDLALQYHYQSIQLAKKTKQPFVEQNNYFNLARLFYHHLQKRDSTLYYMQLADNIAITLKDIYIRDAVERYRAFVALDRNDFKGAMRHAKKAEAFLTEYVDPTEIESSYDDLADIYERLGQANKALVFKKKAVESYEANFTIEKNRQVQELELIYETEKKDSEISLLEKDVELNETKQRALLGGLGLLGLSSISVIYGLWQKRRKDKFIFQKEKDVEMERREFAERELEFKQKELAAKVLQLASKNEFLQELETEVIQLQSTIDTKVNNASKKISRMIQFDTSDDEMWNQFSKEFSSIHSDFIEKLNQQFGSFTKSEVRLISLLKMNLSSKDIANILRISSEGIKKARYRLRKKMNLESNVNLQSYILSLS